MTDSNRNFAAAGIKFVEFKTDLRSFILTQRWDIIQPIRELYSKTPYIGLFREFTEGFNATCLIYHDETFKGDESNHEILKLKLKYIMIIRLVSF